MIASFRGGVKGTWLDLALAVFALGSSVKWESEALNRYGVQLRAKLHQALGPISSTIIMSKQDWQDGSRGRKVLLV